MSDFTLDPNEAEKAALALFEASDDVHEDFHAVTSASADLTTSVDTGEFLGIAEVAEAVEHWEGGTVPKLRARIEEIAQFLAVYTREHVELDEFNAEMFLTVADPSLYPVDAESRSTPAPEPPAPSSGPTYYPSQAGPMQFTE
jgi:hypothetical protein